MSSDVSSQSSYSTGADSSVASSTDARALDSIATREEGGLADDLTEQNRSIEDAVFASLYTLSRNRKSTDWRWTAARVVLEFLQMFRVVFNTVFIWKIDTELWIWKAFYWVLFRLVVLPEGYAAYVTVFYVLSGVVLVALGLTVWIAVILKKDENGGVWIKRLVWTLQLVGLVVFSVFWVAILDYFSFMIDCEWGDYGSTGQAAHVYFHDQNCLAMPHLIHMVCAIVMVLVFVFATLCMSISDCNLNPLTRDHLASPVAITNLKTMGLKMVMVIVSTGLGVLGNIQCVVMVICAAIITYVLLRTLPFYMTLMNCTWIGLWTGLTFTTVILVVLEYGVDAYGDSDIGHTSPAALPYRTSMTMAVLYGIFGAVLVGAGIAYLITRWRRRPLAKLKAAAATATTATNYRDMYRFTETSQAEFLLRDCRNWDEDGVPDPAGTSFGEFLLKVAMARLPNNPYLLTLYSNFIIETRRDGQAARTQLQLAIKASPSLLDRYFIYVAQETAKKLKSEGDGLDLMGYVEFQRSYRACVRAHKLALQTQRGFWHCLLRDKVAFRNLQVCFENMEVAEKQATGVYRRVMDRFPANGRLLKVYGRFLEYVRNDPWNASRFYNEAMKLGTTESLLSLAGSSAEGEQNSLGSLMGNVDEKFDGICIINAAGIIMMINGAACRLLGYEKGELDGKNVSCIMPQPFASRHNGFLQRYTSTGVPHIIGAIKNVVALHKDRTILPIMLTVQRLCGVGSDAVFIGVMRPSTSGDPNTVRVWITMTGSVLCADDRFRDWFGVGTQDIVGHNISSMSTDMEGFDKFVAEAVKPEAIAKQGVGVKGRARILHKYLSPIDTEVSVEYGGTDEHIIVVLVLRCLAEPSALLVTDAKGRIAFANSELGAMVGYNARALADGMNMAALLPPPYAQLHAGLMKDLSAKPGPGSCRSGAVVHLVAANNSKVPVTLQLSQHDDGDNIQHVIRVTPASESLLLNQQRLELALNHRGTVLSVNPGASKAVFGVEPSELVGKSLSSFINVFGQWKAKYGSEEGLLTKLALRVEQSHDVVVRCGLHNPFSQEEIQSRYGQQGGGLSSSTGHAATAEENLAATGGSGGAAATAGGGNTLLIALKSRTKERAAIMTLSMIHAGDEEGADGAAAAAVVDPHLLDGSLTDGDIADCTPLLKLCLWRAEGLASQIEVDSKLNIVRADTCAGLIFGVSTGALLHKSYKKIVGLPSSTTADALLSATGKKSGLKQGAAWKMGAQRTIECRHVDGDTMKLAVQAVSKDGKSSQRLLMVLRVSETTTGSLASLLAMKNEGGGSGNERLLKGQGRASSSGSDEEVGGAAAGGTATTKAPHKGGKQSQRGDDGDSGGGSGGEDKSEDGQDERRPARRRGDSPELHDRLDSRLRTEQWLSSSFKKGRGRPAGGDGEEGSEVDGEPHRSPRGGAASGRHGRPVPKGGARSGKGSPVALKGGRSKFQDEAGEEEVEEDGEPGGHGYVEVHIPVGMPPTGRLGAGFGGGTLGGVGGVGGDNDDAGSVASSSQASGSEALDAGTAASGVDGEDELVADWRRAKRLKKLNRMMTSSLAQKDGERYRRHTYLLTALVTVAHVVCFVVLITQINARYETAQDVNDMAQAIERSQMTAMRANFYQKCHDAATNTLLPFSVCTAENLDKYLDLLKSNFAVLNDIHQGLFLGKANLRQFRDQRLVDKWTYEPLAEHLWYADMGAAQDVVVEGNTTLWEMGNKFLQAALETRFNAKDLGHDLALTPYWNYIQLNGIGSLFYAYTWSLDVFVDFAWAELGTLNNVLVVLLVIEALVVQFSSLVYEFVLLRAATSEAMKRCSAFLALPSATIRSMASRQILVDDDDKSDLDDDEIEAINAAGAGWQTTGGDGNATTNGEGTGKDTSDTKQTTKSVRMNIGGDDDDAPVTASKKKGGAGGKSGASAGAGGTGGAGAKKKVAKSVWSRVQKFLFGWARTTLKVNDKKLLPYTTFLWRYMLPLVLWVATVIIIFGVSFEKLQGLQAPLASLNAAAHVRYRFARCRTMGNMYAFAEDTAHVHTYRAQLAEELALMRAEYGALLYGGEVGTVAPGLHFDPHTPAATFANEQFSQIFFKTRECLRHDTSTCFPETSEWYGVTHSGLDAMVVRYMDEMDTFVNLPDSLAFPNHTSYQYVTAVGANDMYDGLTKAAGMFVEYTIARFEDVKMLHIILLVVSLVLILGFVCKVFRPYVRKLHTESKALAGMMSLLPAEVNIEEHIKVLVLGFSKDRIGGSMRSASMQMEGPPGMMQGRPGMLGGPRGPGGPGAMRLLPSAGGAAPGGWFGGAGRGSAAGGAGGPAEYGGGGWGGAPGAGAGAAGGGYGYVGHWQ